MDVQDFEMPSPKRQRTNSESGEPKTESHATNTSVVEHATTDGQQSSTSISVATVPTSASVSRESNMIEPEITKEEPDMLDFLMQHVESESMPTVIQRDHTAAALPIPTAEANIDTDMLEAHHDIPGLVEPKLEVDDKVEDIPVSGDKMNVVSSQPTLRTDPSQQDPVVALEQESQKEEQGQGQGQESRSSVLPPGLEAASPAAVSQLKAAAEANALPPTAETLLQEHIPAPSNGTGPEVTEHAAEGPEWEVDSSPYSSDSSDTTDSSDDSDDSDDADGYTLLNPIEQARILMAEDGGGGADSDDEEGGTRRTAKVPSSLRTANEKIEAILPKPDVSVSSSTLISELGTVTFFVENTLVITAKTSGEYQVLESGSVLCLGPPSYSVIGAVAETLGRVEEPLYTVRFASDTDVRDSFGLNPPTNPSEVAQDSHQELEQVSKREMGIDTRPLQDQLKNTPIFYVNEHSTFVFTQPLKASKGTDASNIHDEEVGDDEMEFSDDEAEAEHKRLAKLRRKGIDPNSAAGQRGGRGGMRGDRGGQRGGRGGGRGATFSYNTSSHVSETYNPKDNVEMNYDDVEEGEMTTEYAPLRRPESFQHGQNSNFPERQNQSPGQSQHRGGRGGRGANHTTSRGGRGRGRGRGNQQYQSQSQNSSYSQPQDQNHQTTAYQNNQYPDTNNNNNFNYQHNSQPFNPITPSSMYAIPQQQQQNLQTSLPPPPHPSSFQPSMPSTNFDFQAQAQAQWMQYHANQTQQFQQQQYQQQQQQQHHGVMPGFNINAEALAQVQRQLEEMRRNAGQNYQQ